MPCSCFENKDVESITTVLEGDGIGVVLKTLFHFNKKGEFRTKNDLLV